MGTTIDGVYTGGKRARRERALKRLEARLKKDELIVEKYFNDVHDKRTDDETYKLTVELHNNAVSNIARMKKEIETLKSRI